MGRFQDPYYPAHALLLASYSLVHVYCMQNGGTLQGYSRFSVPHDLATWEQQAGLTLAAILGWKALWQRSLDHWLDHLFFYGKVILAVTAALVDYRLFAWYCIIMLVFYAIFPQPMIDFAESEHLQALTGVALKGSVIGSETGAWVVYFYAEGHAASVAMAPAIVELADKYASEHLQFGYLDVSMWPGALKDLKLTDNTWSNQLPAVLLFEKGKEVARLPALSIADSPQRRNHFTKKDVIRTLDLNTRASRAARSTALVVKGKAGGKGGRAD